MEAKETEKRGKEKENQTEAAKCPSFSSQDATGEIGIDDKKKSLAVMSVALASPNLVVGRKEGTPKKNEAGDIDEETRPGVLFPLKRPDKNRSSSTSSSGDGDDVGGAFTLLLPILLLPLPQLLLLLL